MRKKDLMEQGQDLRLDLLEKRVAALESESLSKIVGDYAKAHPEWVAQMRASRSEAEVKRDV